MMHERMLDKSCVPTSQDIASVVGAKAYQWMQDFETSLQSRYDLVCELKYPFGNSYGWGYKYSHKTKHLCYLFFERGSFTITVQIGGKDLKKLDSVLINCLPQTREHWDNRFPCGSGGWVHYRVLHANELDDITQLIAVKKAPTATRT